MGRALRTFAAVLKPLSGVVIVLAALFTAAVAAPVPKLKPGERWVVVASTKNLNTAKGIASHYFGTPGYIMQSQNGWLAVALGPYAATTAAELTKVAPNIGTVPEDTVFSRGANYTDVVWTGPQVASGTLLTEYLPGQPAILSAGTLSVTVEMGGDIDKPGTTIVTGKDNGTQVFRFETDADYGAYGAAAAILKLDPGADGPQIVFTRYTGGAHCCTRTWIITKPRGAAGWSLIEAGTLDGEGHGYEDKDGDGWFEVVNRDNRFLYAFGSYAGSFALSRISQLRGTRLDDVTMQPAWRNDLEQDLGWLEYFKKIELNFTRSNAYLAAWVAAKSALGEGDEAWDIAMKRQEQNPEFGPIECSTGEDVANCPREKLVNIPFDRALAEFLSNTDYPVPAAGQAFLKK